MTGSGCCPCHDLEVPDLAPGTAEPERLGARARPVAVGPPPGVPELSPLDITPVARSARGPLGRRSRTAGRGGAGERDERGLLLAEQLVGGVVELRETVDMHVYEVDDVHPLCLDVDVTRRDPAHRTDEGERGVSVADGQAEASH